MRIVRFVADDGRVLCGEDHGNGTAAVVADPYGILGEDTPVPTNHLRGKSAVVADDDVNMRRIVCTVLEKAGCDCVACADGAEAMKAIAEGSPDLIVSDIMMPHHNGYEIFSAARRRNADLPVLLITGFGYDPDHCLVKAESEGLQAVLYKPFTPKQLLAELCKALDHCNGSAAKMLHPTGETATISAVLTPVDPTNIICIGRNYAPMGDATPSGRPEPPPEELEVFMKPTTSLQASGESIRVPRFDEDVMLDCEGELGVVIGAAAKDIDESEALNCVLGYVVANDVTARRWQTRTGPPQWMRGKGFDTFCPLGPSLVTADEVTDPCNLTITTKVNGVTIRSGSTADMLRPLPQIIAELSRRLSLEPGTLILTGSPPRLPGIPERTLDEGDEVVVEIPGIGRLVNRVVVS